jgi:hypothetical protein
VQQQGDPDHPETLEDQKELGATMPLATKKL